MTIITKKCMEKTRVITVELSAVMLRNLKYCWPGLRAILSKVKFSFICSSVSLDKDGIFFYQKIWEFNCEAPLKLLYVDFKKVIKAQTVPLFISLSFYMVKKIVSAYIKLALIFCLQQTIVN